jgi:hypothetical protein
MLSDWNVLKHFGTLGRDARVEDILRLVQAELPAVTRVDLLVKLRRLEINLYLVFTDLWASITEEGIDHLTEMERSRYSEAEGLLQEAH